MLKNKKNIIIIGIAAAILITALVLSLINWRKARTEKQPGNQASGTAIAAPEFLTTAEKAELKLKDNVRAQILSRNASGTPAVYKIIKSDSDIVSDPSLIEPINPRQSEIVQ